MREQNVRSLNRYISLLGFLLGPMLIPRPFQKFVTVAVGDLFYLLMRRTRHAVQRNLEVIGRGKFSPQRISRLTRSTFRIWTVFTGLYGDTSNHFLQQGYGYSGRGWGGAHGPGPRGGQGAICITPHLGNWEMGGLSIWYKVPLTD